MAWTRLYRPSKISGLHLNSARQQLMVFLKKGKFPNAMIFSGPKGTGKTSTARIIAALLNDPKNEKQVVRAYLKPDMEHQYQALKEADDSPQTQQIVQGKSFMVNEMDAASNRGIDEIRLLKERAALPPQTGMMSVYILDEAHMLTKPAFNALLKLLEEPPPHAIFVLATTEPEKIPDTIVSRSYQIFFQKATNDEIVTALEEIVEKEKLDAKKSDLKLIAQQAEGSFRDAVKLLEMATDNHKIDSNLISQFSGTKANLLVWELIDSILNQDPTGVNRLFEKLRKIGVMEKNFYTNLFHNLHQDMTDSIQGKKAHLSTKVSQFLLSQFSQIEIRSSSPIKFLELELKSLELIFRSQQKNGARSRKRKSQTRSNSTNKDKMMISQPVGDCQKLFDKWDDFIDKVANINSAVAALLRSAKPISAENATLTLYVYYRFHLEQLTHPKTKVLLSKAMMSLIGGVVEINCQLVPPPTQTNPVEPEVINSLTQVAAQTLM